MKKAYKLISMLLTVFMLLSSISVLFTVNVFAADETTTETGTETGTEGTTETPEEKPNTSTQEGIDYINTVFPTPGDKLATMRLALEKDGYQLYVDDYSGEVACVNAKTGEHIFTNPYDVAASTGYDTTKYEVLSQIIVHFTDQQGQDKYFNSYEEAYKRGQIVTEPIKNGVRVEYTIGREQTKTLVPRLISKERFDDIIMGAALEAFGEDLYSDDPSVEVFKFQKFLTYYVLYSKEKLDITAAERKKMNTVFGGVYDDLISSDRSLTAVLKDYPIVDTMPVYVFDPTASESEIAMCEELILTYCPDYTYEELDYDHALTEYESEDENPPVFRMALEYKIDENGFTVRLPANGIRFNESLYTLEEIDVLPYMGAGNGGYEGYNFFPDGSGTLFDFQQLNTDTVRSVHGKVYGTDFAYNEISGTYQKVIRYPVFGIVEETSYYTYTETDIDTGEVTSQKTISGAIVEAIRSYAAGEKPKAFKGKESMLATAYGTVINNVNATETYGVAKRGFLAIIEEGDALATLTTYHGGSLHDYNTIKMSFTPRPKDSYNLKDSISVASNSEWTVVCSRKYVGGYTMRYVLLSDGGNEAITGEETYDASWLGMAIAYRDYLTEKGVLSKIDSDKLTDDIPLYIETFGTVETIEKILSIPVTVMAPLTTFEDILAMYNELSTDIKDDKGNVLYKGIKNINFKLTGYANGGMYYTVPGKLKFEKSVGGDEGFQNLLNEAAKINAADKNNNLGIYPDFDFVYMIDDEWFNGFQASDHAARKIDDRYASKREYMPTQQKYTNYYELVISPAYFSRFYEMLKGNYADKYQNVTGISVSTLGSDLHSDFDEDEPYNREDSKDFTIKAFEYMDKNYAQVMTAGGNSYTWKYVDHILDVSLDSSRYNFSANAVPFIGVVLHGSVSFAGEPLNMEGDIQYAILKAIENGASPYFILSKQNTQVLKKYYDLSQYYSIRYDIWSKDIVEVYNTLNNALGDVQDKYIIGHEFLEGGKRIPDISELEEDIYNEFIKDLEDERNAAELLAKEIAQAASIARANGREAEAYANLAIINAIAQYEYQANAFKSSIAFDEEYYNRALNAYREFEKVRAYSKSEVASEKAQYTRGVKIRDTVTNFNVDAADVIAVYDSNMKAIEKLQEDLGTAVASYLTKVVNRELARIYKDSDAKAAAEAIVKKLNSEYTGKTDDDLIKFVSELLTAEADKDALIDVVVDEIVGLIKEAIAKNTPEDENETIDETNLIKDLKSTIKGKLNKMFESEASTALTDALATDIAKNHVNDDDNALEAAIIAIIFAEAKNKEAAGDKLYTSFVSDLAKNTIKVYNKSDIGKTRVNALYNAYINAINNYNNKKASSKATEAEIAAALEAVNAAKAELDAVDAELVALSELYFEYVAANSAHNLVLSSGLALDFEECKDAYFEFEKTNVYSGFKKLALAAEATDEYKNYYAEYVAAKDAKDELEAEADSYVQTKGSFDNYLVARAQLAIMIELGYDKSEDEDTLKTYNNAKSQVESTRTTAINGVARIEGANLAELIKNYETLVAHLELAVAAIDVLALAEGVEVKYAEGKEGTLEGITNYNEIAAKSSIVKQAIDRAQATYDYLNNKNPIMIVDGRETEYEINGIKLSYTRNEKGERIYFFGEAETGYSYFTLVKDEETGESHFEIYHLGTKNGAKVDDLDVYEYKEGKVKKYYTATLEDGYKYYDYDADYEVYLPAAAKVYNGVKVPETELLYDEKYDVYYTEDGDGTYTRYTYNKSVTDYYEEAVAKAKELKDLAAELGKLSGDMTVAEDVQKRIDRNNASIEKEEEEVVEEEEDFRYTAKNIVAVTYGNDDGSAYKTFILNYNNYAIRIEFEGVEYTIPAYEFVTINRK